MSGFWHPLVQDNALRTIEARQQARQRALTTATPELANSIGEVYKKAHFLKPTQVIPLAKSGASQQAVDLANKTASSLTLAEDTQEQDTKNFFEKAFYEPIKKATRYTFAALNLFPEAVQNTAATIFNNAPGGDFLGSTTLGTMLSGQVDEGTGFFASDAVMKKQGEMARKYRGTVADTGKAFTVGRGAASLFLPEDSMAYNLLSGLVDGAIGYYADPTMIGGKYLKSYRMAKNAIPDTTAAKAAVTALQEASKLDEARILQESIDAAEDAVRRGLPRPSIIGREEARNLAGNLDEQKKIWDGTEFMKWWSTNKGAQQMEKSIKAVVLGFDDYKKGLVAKLDGLTGKDLQIQQAKNLAEETVRKNYTAYKIQDELFDGTITHEQALKFLESGQDPRYIFAESAARLGGAPGAGELGMFPTDIRDLTGAQTKILSRFANATVYRVPKVKKFAEKQLEVGYKSHLLVRGTPEDRFRAVQNIDRMLALVKGKLPEGAYEKIIGRAAAAYNASTGSPTAIYETREIVKDTVATVLRDGFNVPEKAIRKAIADYDIQFEKLRQRITTELGDNPGHKLIRSLIDQGWVDEGSIIKTLAGKGTAITSIDDLDARVISPTVLSELLHNIQVLPDPKQLRALTSNPFWKRTIGLATKTGEGNSRALLNTIEYIQNDLWKPLTLMNPGYIARNLLDGQFHVALAGEKNLSGLFNNPVAFFMVALGKRAPETITGEALTKKGLKAAKGVEDTSEFSSLAHEIALESIGSNTAAWAGDAADAAYTAMRSGDYTEVSRLGNENNHTMGILDQLRMVFMDKVVRSGFFAGNAKALKGSDEVDHVMEIFTKRPELRQKALGLAKAGFIYGEDSGKWVRVKPTLSQLSDEDQLLRSWVQTEVFGRVNKWKDTPELRVIAAHNKIPYMEGGQTRAVVDNIVPTQEVLDRVVSYEGKMGVGTILKSDNPAYDLVVINTRRGMVPLPSQTFGVEKYVMRDIWDVVRVRADEEAFGKNMDFFKLQPYSDNAVDVINRVYNSADNAANELIPARTGVMVRTDPNDQKGMARAMDKWKETTNWWFNTVAGGAMEKFEKSPIFRQLYHKYAMENADLLSKDEYAKLLANIKSGAERLGMSERAYVNMTAKEYSKLVSMADSAKGAGTVEQLNEFAARHAKTAMKGMLFDAAERRNVEETLRIIMPFGAAWREVLTKYIGQIADDPSNLRKIERVFTGATKVDLEGDGTGFFYKDPQTGQYMFNFPLTDKLSKVFTGLTAPMVAPVKGLNVGLSYFPAFGPVGQIGADMLLPFVPKENDFRKTFLPYGTPGSKFMDFAPGWLRKTIDAVQANPDKMDGVYSQLYVETVRALYASGKYDLSKIDDKERLLNDARGKARILSLFRAANQFVGPASGSPRFELKTDQGDVYMAHLVREFQKLQENNYDTSVQEFLNTYGDDMMLYISGKSKSEISGLQPTQVFDDWAQQNKSIMKKYKETAGFFAPAGDEFSFQVWKDQIDRGERTRLTADQVIAQAQLMVGSAKYRAARLKFGPYPTREQQAWLREYRAALNSELPGFPKVASFDPAEFPTFVDQLKQIIADPKMQGNQVAQATSMYLERRDMAIQAANEAGFVGLSSRSTTGLRNYLASIAEELIKEYPEFRRIYEQKLQAELMQYTEE